MCPHTKNEFKLTPELLESAITPKTKAILLNYPSNPTGGFMTKEDYEKIVPIIKKHELIVITDEIYAELSYEQKFCSIASFDEIKDQVILVSGFSKAYAMTGWRLGYVLANEVIINAMNKIHQYVIMSAPTAAQPAFPYRISRQRSQEMCRTLAGRGPIFIRRYRHPLQHIYRCHAEIDSLQKDIRQGQRP